MLNRQLKEMKKKLKVVQKEGTRRIRREGGGGGERRGVRQEGLKGYSCEDETRKGIRGRKRKT